MKFKTTSPYLRTLILFAAFAVTASSCKKDGDHEAIDPIPVEYHQTAVTRFTPVGSTMIAYRILGEGNGIPLIMISQLGGTMDDWDPAITNGLAQKRKVILFDIEGTGSSEGKTPDNIAEMAKGIVSFTRAMGYQKADFLGFSMGSFITQQIALTEPALVNKMILTGTGPKGAEGLSNLPELLAGVAGLSAEESFLKFGFTNSSASIQAGKAAYRRIQKRTINRDKPVNEESTNAEIKAVLAWAQPYPNAFSELSTLSQPTLIIQGDSDLPVPVINARKMSESLPNASLTVFHDAGHPALFQDPGKFLSLALPFLGISLNP